MVNYDAGECTIADPGFLYIKGASIYMIFFFLFFFFSILKHSMAPLQVIGAGFGRTGTDSLRMALEMLG